MKWLRQWALSILHVIKQKLHFPFNSTSSSSSSSFASCKTTLVAPKIYIYSKKQNLKKKNSPKTHQHHPTHTYAQTHAHDFPALFSAVALTVIASFRKIKSLSPKGQPPRMLITLLAEALADSPLLVSVDFYAPILCSSLTFSPSWLLLLVDFFSSLTLSPHGLFLHHDFSGP